DRRWLSRRRHDGRDPHRALLATNRQPEPYRCNGRYLSWRPERRAFTGARKRGGECMDPVREIARGQELPTKPFPREVWVLEEGLKRMLAGLAPARLTGPHPARIHQAPVAAPIPESLLKAEIEA